MDNNKYEEFAKTVPNSFIAATEEAIHSALIDVRVTLPDALRADMLLLSVALVDEMERRNGDNY